MMHMPDLKALSPWVAAFGVTPQARIATATGQRPAGELAVGDLVKTQSAGLQPLTDVRRTIGAPAERNHFPVWICEGALGYGLPHRDIELGPQHRIMLQSFRISLAFGEDAVLVRAKSLVASHDHVAVRKAMTPASFVQLTLAKQDLIYAEGLPVETILPDGECDLPYPTIRSWELMAVVA